MFMALRVALWVLTILLVLIAPSCYSYEARKFWSDRFKKLFACGWRCCCCCCCCRRNTETPPVSPATAAAANRGDRYV